MDLYEYLKLDHDHVAHLFKQFNDSDSKIRKQQIVELIAEELIAHAKAEQKTFYKALEKHLNNKQQVFHAWKEHQEIEAQIDKVLHEKSFRAPWINKVKKLQDLVDHHVREEESSIFKIAKKALSKEDANVIKEHMHYLKQQIKTS